jgi:FlaA1/EpsC-like NDP-sugar epimerase/lipopolysaccharide/colanic/teichoic acid biosynthesis glycosyltransferase
VRSEAMPPGAGVLLKRAIDVLGALLALAALSPVLLASVIAIKFSSPGPVLYTTLRVGKGGRLYRLYKFRSIVGQSRPGSPVTTNGKAPRISRAGRVIRLLRLEELPQFLNVLRGDMSLVGPRPQTPSIVERYTPEQREILLVRPGLTGPSQVAWLDEESRSQGADPEQYVDPEQHYITHMLPQHIQWELSYVRGRSLGRDLLYLFQTPFVLTHLILTRFQLILIRLSLDCVIVAAVTYAAYLVRFDGILPADSVVPLLYGLPLVVASYALAFYATRTYLGIWRYVGVEDFWRLLGACGLGGVIAGALLYLMRSPYPRSVLLLTPILAMMVMGGARVAVRSIVGRSERAPWVRDRRRVVILGAGSAGQSVAREILRTRPLGYEIVGFADDDPRLRGATLHTLPVIGTTAQLDELARKHRLDEAIVAIPRLGLADLRRIGESCARAGLEFKTMPSMEQLIRGEGSLRYLRRVDLDDLLRREPLSLDPKRVADFVRDKRVMVTGAGGSIGSELCRQLTALGAGSLLMVDRVENGLFDIGSELETRPAGTKLTAALADVKHVTRMAELFDHFKPDIVFHAAAYKHVPLLESHPIEAVLNNVVGTVRLARLAKAYGTGTFTLISTDKAVKPTNLMGATKRICELYMMAMNARQRALPETEPGTSFRVVRFGNVLGSSGSAVPLFQRQIENSSAITITHPEVSRFFMTIQEAVALVLESVMLETTADALVLDMGEPVKITELANDLVTALGLQPATVAKQVIGLRPGEKLHEVLWDDDDEVGPSGHPRLVAVRQRVRPLVEIDELVTEIERLALEGRVAQFLRRVSELVPSYVPSYEYGHPVIMELGGRRTDRASTASEVTPK